jgi:hypothetical protein
MTVPTDRLHLPPDLNLGWVATPHPDGSITVTTQGVFWSPTVTVYYVVDPAPPQEP